MIQRVRVLAVAVILMQAACANETQDGTHHDKATDVQEKAPAFTATAALAGAELYIIWPQDGATVTSPVRIQFGLRGMGVAPAGVDAAKTGHHHLLIDVDELPDMSGPLPATDAIRHFGGGQTEVSVELAPGEHTLQLLLGNYIHVPHSPPILSPKITVAVE